MSRCAVQSILLASWLALAVGCQREAPPVVSAPPTTASANPPTTNLAGEPAILAEPGHPRYRATSTFAPTQIGRAHV